MILNATFIKTILIEYNETLKVKGKNEGEYVISFTDNKTLKSIKKEYLESLFSCLYAYYNKKPIPENQITNLRNLSIANLDEKPSFSLKALLGKWCCKRRTLKYHDDLKTIFLDYITRIVKEQEIPTVMSNSSDSEGEALIEKKDAGYRPLSTEDTTFVKHEQTKALYYEQHQEKQDRESIFS